MSIASCPECLQSLFMYNIVTQMDTKCIRLVTGSCKYCLWYSLLLKRHDITYIFSTTTTIIHYSIYLDQVLLRGGKEKRWMSSTLHPGNSMQSNNAWKSNFKYGKERNWKFSNQSPISFFARHKSIDFRVRVQILGLHLIVKLVSANLSVICEMRMILFSLKVFRQIRLLRWEDQRSAQHRVHVN